MPNNDGAFTEIHLADEAGNDRGNIGGGGIDYGGGGGGGNYGGGGGNYGGGGYHSFSFSNPPSSSRTDYDDGYYERSQNLRLHMLDLKIIALNMYPGALKDFKNWLFKRLVTTHNNKYNDFNNDFNLEKVLPEFKLSEAYKKGIADYAIIQEKIKEYNAQKAIKVEALKNFVNKYSSVMNPEEINLRNDINIDTSADRLNEITSYFEKYNENFEKKLATKEMVKDFVNRNPQYFQGELGENVQKWMKATDAKTLQNLENMVNDIKRNNTKDIRDFINENPEQFQGEFGENVQKWMNSNDPKTVQNVRDMISQKKKEKEAANAKAQEAEAIRKAQEAEAIRINAEEDARIKEEADSQPLSSEIIASRNADAEAIVREKSKGKIGFPPLDDIPLNRDPNENFSRNLLLQMRDVYVNAAANGRDSDHLNAKETAELENLYAKLTPSQQEFVDHPESSRFIRGEDDPNAKKDDEGVSISLNEERAKEGHFSYSHAKSTNKEMFVSKSEGANDDIKQLQDLLGNPTALKVVTDMGISREYLETLIEKAKNSQKNIINMHSETPSYVNIPLKASVPVGRSTRIIGETDLGFKGGEPQLGGKTGFFKIGVEHKFGGRKKKQPTLIPVETKEPKRIVRNDDYERIPYEDISLNTDPDPNFGEKKAKQPTLIPVQTKDPKRIMRNDTYDEILLNTDPDPNFGGRRTPYWWWSLRNSEPPDNKGFFTRTVPFDWKDSAAETFIREQEARKAKKKEEEERKAKEREQEARKDSNPSIPKFLSDDLRNFREIEAEKARRKQEQSQNGEIPSNSILTDRLTTKVMQDALNLYKKRLNEKESLLSNWHGRRGWNFNIPHAMLMNSTSRGIRG